MRHTQKRPQAPPFTDKVTKTECLQCPGSHHARPRVTPCRESEILLVIPNQLLFPLLKVILIGKKALSRAEKCASLYRAKRSIYSPRIGPLSYGLPPKILKHLHFHKYRYNIFPGNCRPY